MSGGGDDDLAVAALILYFSWIGEWRFVEENGGVDKDHSAIRFEDGPGEIAGFATHGVKYDVDVADEILKAGGFVVNDLVGAEVFDKGQVWSRGSCNDVV